jgi:CTP:molybdopterin cytidylyltransferase MocA
VELAAIVTAGDQRAAKAVYGQSKVFLEVDGRPMVARTVVTLQAVPEIDAVWVVGNRERLEAVFADPSVQADIHKPLYIVEQKRNLMENSWETFRHVIAGSLEEARDPVGDEIDTAVLYLSADLPLATPQEISAFVQQSAPLECDYACGLVTDESLEAFRPQAPGETGIEVAFFNLREGRFRQSNLHYAAPARIGNRWRLEDMYEHRHQREFWNMAILAWKLFFSQAGGPRIAFLYGVMHFASWLDRLKLSSVADRLRGYVTIARNEETICRVLDTRFRFVVTQVGGCAIDVDTDEEYDIVREHFDAWTKAQASRAEALYGPLPTALAAGSRSESNSDG